MNANIKRKLTGLAERKASAEAKPSVADADTGVDATALA